MTTVSKRDSMDATLDEVQNKMKDAKLDQSKPTGKPSLATLPPSIRNNIYKHLLDTEFVNVGKPNVSYTHSIKDNVLQFKASRPPFPVNTAIFHVNRQISAEAIQYFYSQNLFVRLSLYTSNARHAKTMLEDSGVLFSVASPETVEKSKSHAMDLSIVEKNSSQKRATVLFPAQYLPRLINFLDQAGNATKKWGPSHSIFINVLNTYNFPIARLQGDLLELFRLLTNIGNVEVDSKNLLPGYAESLQQSMTVASFDPQAWLTAVTEIADSADAAREARNWEIGNQHGQSAIIALTYAYLTRAEPLHSQPEDFSKSVQRLRWRCELGIGKAMFKQHQKATESKDWLTDPKVPLEERKAIARDMLLAETSTSQALSLATDSPNPSSNPWFQTLPAETIPPNKATWFTDEERGITWYACGIVHMVLGEYLFAAGDLERAVGLRPEGKNFEDAFAKAREGIDWKVRPGTGLRRAARLARG
ncbi:hypothetical protein K469DRAFT_165480 [Zopfia rhizophila CBS 207.26]|uniref:F-box domain-containing protein n=1 Tax=Zopfia rhizophila CBS 207.26 TaxID=1314779 RepID=A0A6A6E513_9PEZI|nr:hypothetical protein K469DRAFT_165480 [Zopfia rhizophila CBS 207.26]